MLATVRLADLLGHGAEAENFALTLTTHSKTISFIDTINEVLKENSALSLKDLAINGADIIALGAHPGPVIGKILDELLNYVLHDNSNNTKEFLLTKAKTLLQEEEN
jgi:hypothetical protein